MPPHPIDKHVGNRLRMRRRARGLSQERLGNEVGLTFQQIQKYESGANRISASRLQQFAGVLDVPVAFFFEGLPQAAGGSKPRTETPSPPHITAFLASPDGRTLAEAFMRINPASLRRSILRLVQTLAAGGF